MAGRSNWPGNRLLEIISKKIQNLAHQFPVLEIWTEGRQGRSKKPQVQDVGRDNAGEKMVPKTAELDQKKIV